MQFGIKAPYVHESYIEQNSGYNVINSCNKPFLSYLESNYSYEAEADDNDNHGVDEQYQKEKKYLEEF